MHSSKTIMVLVSVSLLLAACTPGKLLTPTTKPVLQVMTHDSFSLSETVVREYEIEKQRHP